MYHFDSYDQSLVIDGWEQGIAKSPHQGLANLQNVNVVSIPGEVSVGFSTSQVSPTSTSGGTGTFLGTITSFVSGGTTVSYLASPSMTTGLAIKFTGIGSYTGITVGSVYWLAGVSTTTTTGSMSLYANTGTTYGSIITLAGSGNAAFQSVDLSQPKYFTSTNPTDGSARNYYCIDAKGRVWVSTPAFTGWRYSGNEYKTGVDSPNGNGIVAFKGLDNKQWIFAFNNSTIDYCPDATTSFAWVYGWNPTTGTTNNSAIQLNTLAGQNLPHEALVGQDNVIYYCDQQYIGSIAEVSSGAGFNPTVTSTYTYASKALTIPAVDNANCLAEVGINLMVGGQRNLIYPWDRISTSYKYPLWIADNIISKMITVNALTYIFAGNRGRIYVTNGTSAELYKKIPDHISATLEPYYAWGGVAFSKNNLYFSAFALTNADAALNGYGGVWAIDTDSEAMRLTQQLSYATYQGYATAIIPQLAAVSQSFTGGTPPGAGLFIGWDNGVNGFGGVNAFGIDGTNNTPYTGSQASVESDLIPIGTFGKPRDSQQVEFKLVKPLVAGESVTLYSRTDFSQTYGTMSFISPVNVGDISGTASANWKNAQWLQLKAVLNSTTTSPSYVRLKQLRVTGFVGQSLQSQQQLSI